MKVANLIYFFFGNAAAGEITGDCTAEFPVTQCESTGKVSLKGNCTAEFPVTQCTSTGEVEQQGGYSGETRKTQLPWIPRPIDEVLRVAPLPLRGQVRAKFPVAQTQAAGTRDALPIGGRINAHFSFSVHSTVARVDRSRLDLDDELILLEVA